MEISVEQKAWGLQEGKTRISCIIWFIERRCQCLSLYLYLCDQDFLFWVMVFRVRFQRNVVPSKPRETSKHWKMKASPSFETSGTDYFVTQRHTREERNTKPHSYEQLKTHNDRWRNNERKSSWRNLRTWLDKFWKKLRKVAKHLNQKGRPAFWPRFKHRPFDYT